MVSTIAHQMGTGKYNYGITERASLQEQEFKAVWNAFVVQLRLPTEVLGSL